MAADIYLPVEFGTGVSMWATCGWPQRFLLSETLEEMKEELAIEDDEYEDEDDEEDDEEGRRPMAQSSKPSSATSGNSWSMPVAESLEKSMVLHLRSEMPESGSHTHRADRPGLVEAWPR